MRKVLDQVAEDQAVLDDHLVVVDSPDNFVLDIVQDTVDDSQHEAAVVDSFQALVHHTVADIAVADTHP